MTSTQTAQPVTRSIRLSEATRLAIHLGMDSKLGEFREAALVGAFEAVFRHCQELLAGIEIETDRSPVMGSPSAYLAKLEHCDAEHSRPRMILNGLYLDGLGELGGVGREFLIQHEAFHAYCLSETLPQACHGRTEEECADLFALYSLIRNAVGDALLEGEPCGT